MTINIVPHIVIEEYGHGIQIAYIVGGCRLPSESLRVGTIGDRAKKR